MRQAALMLLILISSVALADDQSTTYQKGLSDRATWEAWFNSLEGDFKTGAFYWSSQRSLSQPGSCRQMSAEFTAGCTAAKNRLDPSDALRRSQPDYKLGWNAWAPSMPDTRQPPLRPVVSTAPNGRNYDDPPAFNLDDGVAQWCAQLPPTRDFIVRKARESLCAYPRKATKSHAVRVGMSSTLAWYAWGNPNHINVSVGVSGRNEQWVYPDDQYLYFTDGTLTHIQIDSIEGR